MSNGLIYSPVNPIDPEELSRIWERGQVSEIADAMLSCAMLGGNFDFAVRSIERCYSSQIEAIVALSVQCVGHVARVYGDFPLGKAETIILSSVKSESESIKASGENTLDDLSVYMPALHASLIRRIESAD